MEKKVLILEKKTIIKWYKIYKYKNLGEWNSEALANRIINLIYNFEYINSLSTPIENKILKKILNKNISRFNIELYFKKNGNLSLLELKAHILINLIVNKKKN